MIKVTRRTMLGGTASAGAAGLLLHSRSSAWEVQGDTSLTDRIDAACEAPVLVTQGLNTALVIESVELLRNGSHYLVRVRTRDGAEGLAVANGMHFVHTYPIFLNRVAPFFPGKDARELEPLLWELYREGSNYKYQGLAFWVCVAAVEVAILDLLGKASGRSLAELLGGRQRKEIAVYTASGTRGNTPEQEIEDLRRLVEKSQARAIKFRLGGMMSLNRDSLPGRSETLIKRVREEFGAEMTLYADANSSYDAVNAIRIGRMMQEYGYAFLEEPCRFDHFEETKAVADALEIPVAGGEQEASTYGFRWMIAHRGVDIVQPDLHYHGGFIRSIRVARMAHAAGMKCTPHMSGSGLGYLDAAHFVSIIPNPTEFTEFKGNTDIPVSSPDSSLRAEGGVVRVPSGPGYGVTIAPDFLARAQVLKRG